MRNKLAACYTVWNGLELLNGSIKQIENDVDLIIIAWQWRSNKSERSNEIESFLEQYKDNPKIKLVEFIPNLSNTTKLNELNKHNLLLDTARQFECTHVFLSATDHFYKPEEFRRAKKVCYNLNLDTTFTKMYTYYKRPTWQIEPIEAYLMPFILKLSNESKFVFDMRYAFKVDPSLKITPVGKALVFEPSDIMMHHYSMIRKDIKNKFNNAAASIKWDSDKINGFVREYEFAKVGDSIRYFGARKIKEVDNYFDIQ